MIVESFFIGLVIGFLFYEIVGVSPGGVIAPAYFALFIHQPGKIAVTVLITIVVWLIILFLSRWLIVYGRRKLLIALILGFLFKLLFEFKLQPAIGIQVDLQSIGYIIPGLVANEMVRQKAVPTLAALGMVTILVYLILLFFN
ncbi:MAG TPA: poly-gamma-glutamate biosynthesis protein PgsC [Ignavibacteriaceae bacterium]